MIMVMNLAALLPLAITVAVLLRGFQSGDANARIAVAGLLVAAAGTVVQMLALAGVIPPTVIARNAFQASVGFMLLFFVVAVTRRTWMLRRTELQQREEVLRQQLERERTEKELQHRIAETEMAALRSQMNPHFIFNALNSINTYVLRNEADLASGFLTRFARLMRLVLENSRFAEVPLQEDLEALELYLHLERVRCGERFTYGIDVDPALDPGTVLVPPLVLQPFVENAIWHGLAGLDRPGRIQLTMRRDGDEVVMSVEDNGGGRHAVHVVAGGPKKSSLATVITRERLGLIARRTGRRAEFTYADLAPGTRVEVRIPLET
jgi:LytS/YehU family sensor histidine kinase